MRPDAVILAGGLSRRFGRDKAAAPWRGRTLAEHVAAALPAGTGRRILVLRRPGDPQPLRADRVVHDDPALPPGPLRGVIAGLEACATECAWVLACDLPALSCGVLEALAAAFRPGDDVVLPESAGRIQPLCALYAVRAAAPLRAAATTGRGSLLAALASLHVRVLGEAAQRRADPHDASFQNINTPADLDRLEATR